jgi:hypothetical protein
VLGVPDVVPLVAADLVAVGVAPLGAAVEAGLVAAVVVAGFVLAVPADVAARMLVLETVATTARDVPVRAMTGVEDSGSGVASETDSLTSFARASSWTDGVC